MKENIKKELIRISVVFFSMFFLVLIAFFCVQAQKTTSQKKLIKMLEKYIELALDEDYSIETKIDINTRFSESLAFYRIKNEKKTAILVLARITGFSGPQSCLFFYDEDFRLNFISVLAFRQDVEYMLAENHLDYGITDSILNYWKDSIQKALGEGGII